MLAEKNLKPSKDGIPPIAFIRLSLPRLERIVRYSTPEQVRDALRAHTYILPASVALNLIKVDGMVHQVTREQYETIISMNKLPIPKTLRLGKPACVCQISVVIKATSVADEDISWTAITLIQKSPTRECAQCGINAPNMQKCGKCRAVYYCNAKCQLQHWHTSHKKTCTKK